MTTLAPAPFRDILKDAHRRVLQIPPPTGRLEKVVADAVAALAKKYAHDLDKAEETIEKYGLTIEVTRLRDRLARAASTDLQRLMLSTPGVPEALFNAAIEQQLEQEEGEDSNEASTGRLATSGASKVATKRAAPTARKASPAKGAPTPSRQPAPEGGSTS